MSDTEDIQGRHHPKIYIAFLTRGSKGLSQTYVKLCLIRLMFDIKIIWASVGG